MEHRAIAGTGLSVSRMCLGTMMFGGQTDREESVEIIHRALDGGVDFIDTANIYNRGVSEDIVGEALEGIRRNAVLATKVGGPAWDGPGGRGLGRAHVMAAVEESLRRLRTDYIDIYYYHFPDHVTPAEEMIETMDILITSFRAVRCSMSKRWKRAAIRGWPWNYRRFTAPWAAAPR